MTSQLVMPSEQPLYTRRKKYSSN